MERVYLLGTVVLDECEIIESGTSLISMERSYLIGDVCAR
jgi:hypothetical protein